MIRKHTPLSEVTANDLANELTTFIVQQKGAVPVKNASRILQNIRNTARTWAAPDAPSMGMMESPLPLEEIIRIREAIAACLQTNAKTMPD
ncbi:MAG TPA: hypothetical protein VHA78_01860 [Candidatus Peribacteraceae bacterium]|nr:hypothetical protein [Candidatus Peribacteraceae bacterium]